MGSKNKTIVPDATATENENEEVDLSSILSMPARSLEVDSILFDKGVIIIEEEDKSEFTAFRAKQKILSMALDPGVKDIHIFFNSGGGDVDTFVGLYGAIEFAQKFYKKKVTSIVNGYAASGAAFASQAASFRAITRNSFFMIHEMRYQTGEGTVNDHLNNAEAYNKFQNVLFKVWAQKMGISIKELKDLLHKKGPDVWYDAHGAVKAGLADEVI